MVARPASPRTSPVRSPPDDAAAFYASSRGQLAASLLAERVRPLLPSPGGRTVLGLGHARPLFDRWPELGTARWAGTARLDTPATRRAPLFADETWARRDCLTGADYLPFDDLSLDLVVILHGLELVDPAALLRAVWKALADDGRLVLIVPNSRGFWGRDRATPFGLGAPFSAGRLDQLLARAMLGAEEKGAALAIPPSALGFGLVAARAMDRTGLLLARGFAGVHVVVARKDLYAGLPLQPEGATASLGRRIVETSPS